MMIIAVAILVFLHRRGLIVATPAAIEGKRNQATADHQSEYDADTQERVAPIGQFNAAGVCRPPLIGTVQSCSDLSIVTLFCVLSQRGANPAGGIPCSDLRQTSNNISQKGLAFARERSGSAKP